MCSIEVIEPLDVMSVKVLGIIRQNVLHFLRGKKKVLLLYFLMKNNHLIVMRKNMAECLLVVQMWQNQKSLKVYMIRNQPMMEKLVLLDPIRTIFI